MHNNCFSPRIVHASFLAAAKYRHHICGHKTPPCPLRNPYQMCCQARPGHERRHHQALNLSLCAVPRVLTLQKIERTRVTV
eukprot:5515151-Amphidinium_carterae.2